MLEKMGKIQKPPDLEIIFQVLWDKRINLGYEKVSSLVGMYDIPNTTLDLKTFKAYLVGCLIFTLN